MADLFPKELEEAKRYRSQKNRLTKVIAKQRLEEEYSDELIELVKDAFRKQGPTNLLGVWAYVQELLGYDSFKKIQADITNVVWCGAFAGIFWRDEDEYDCLFGIRGEQNKQEWLEKYKSNDAECT